MDLVAHLTHVGGIAHVSELRRHGTSADVIERAARRGTVRRLRRGWYAIPGADETAQRLVTLGARIGCVSALAHHGAWTLPSPTLHVDVPRGTRLARDGLTIHWTDERGPRSVRAADPVVALGRSMRCLPRDDAVVALDSCLNRRIVSPSTAEWLAAGSRRAERIVATSDPAAESGLETLARIRLRARGVGVRTQARVADVGRVDLLVGEQLVVELDGERWHSAPADVRRDRRRDRALVVAGFLVIRLGYDDVVHHWSEVEEQILALVRAGRHRAPRVPLRS